MIKNLFNIQKAGRFILCMLVASSFFAVRHISQAATLTPDQINHILSTGQSLAVGMGTNEGPLSTSQSYGNLMLNRVGTAGGFPAPVDLKEINYETPNSGMANFLARTTGQIFASSNHAVSGQCYDALRKGTTTGLYAYDHGIRQMQAVQAWAKANGKSYRVTAVTAIHGECDERSGNGTAYRGYLEKWQQDYQADIKQYTQQSGIIPLFTDQMSSWTMYNRSTPTVALAQLEAAESNPGRIVLVGPKYFLPYFDGVHLTSRGYRWLGQYYGKVIKKVSVDGQNWKPLSPQGIVREGRVVTVTFHVPQGPLRFDTVAVREQKHFGFEYSDSSTNPPSIEKVEIKGNAVEITLTKVPTSNSGRIRYAYTGLVGAAAGAQSMGSARGNLRDSDSTASEYGDPLYNWAVHFDKPITQIVTQPTAHPSPTTQPSSTPNSLKPEAPNIPGSTQPTTSSTPSSTPQPEGGVVSPTVPPAGVQALQSQEAKLAASSPSPIIAQARALGSAITKAGTQLANSSAEDTSFGWIVVLLGFILGLTTLTIFFLHKRGLSIKSKIAAVLPYFSRLRK